MTETNAWAKSWLTKTSQLAASRSRKPLLVQNLSIQPAVASARVHEGRSVRPYHTRLRFPAPSSQEWQVWLFHRGLPPWVLGQLFAEECSPELIHAFERAHVPLVSDMDAIEVSCTCTTSGWCKHSQALWLRIAQEIERHPATLLRLMGLDEAALRHIFESALAPFPLTGDDEGSEPLADAESFWGSQEPLPQMPALDSTQPSDHVLRAMGIPPLWPTGQALAPVLRPIYEAARQMAEDRERMLEETPSSEPRAPRE